MLKSSSMAKRGQNGSGKGDTVLKKIFLQQQRQKGPAKGDTVREDIQDIATGEEADELDHLKVTQ